MNAHTSKASIRREKITLRQQLGGETYRQLCTRIHTRLAAVLEPESDSIATYYAMRGEPDISDILPYEQACLPVLVQGSRIMMFRKVIAGHVLLENRYGCKEPAEDAPVCQPDIVIVPLAAFDKRGFRIGYGGGYYDATLADLRRRKPVTAIGVGFSFQEVDHIPAEAFDEKLDMVITDSVTMRFR